MTLDSIQSLIRAILNIFAGGMIAKGYGDDRYWEQVAAAVLMIATMVWGYYHNQAKPRTKRKRRKNKRNTQ